MTFIHVILHLVNLFFLMSLMWFFNYYYFLIRNSNENNLIYLLLTRWRKNKWILIGIVYWASSGRLSSFVHHVVVNVKLDPQEKLFVLTIFSGFIGLCRVSIMQYMELLDKKLTGPGPEMSVQPGATFILFFSFFCDFFSNRKS